MPGKIDFEIDGTKDFTNSVDLSNDYSWHFVLPDFTKKAYNCIWLNLMLYMKIQSETESVVKTHGFEEIGKKLQYTLPLGDLTAVYIFLDSVIPTESNSGEHQNLTESAL